MIRILKSVFDDIGNYYVIGVCNDTMTIEFHNSASQPSCSGNMIARGNTKPIDACLATNSKLYVLCDYTTPGDLNPYERSCIIEIEKDKHMFITDIKYLPELVTNLTLGHHKDGIVMLVPAMELDILKAREL